MRGFSENSGYFLYTALVNLLGTSWYLLELLVLSSLDPPIIEANFVPEQADPMPEIEKWSLKDSKYFSLAFFPKRCYVCLFN